ETLSIRARFGHLPAGFGLPDDLSLVRQMLESEVLNLHARLARDLTYTSFYKDEDYPVLVHMTQPLYFEIELHNESSNAELFLENCWATGSVEMV
ncbi:zona pellucida domain-containing protein, partial [Salmonella enterica subsp. enterica serovar Typhimurium]|nr:zona pellucida domain-containing protein [Salmonella enterica subsp. enterica serovar Typhimurium]